MFYNITKSSQKQEWYLKFDHAYIDQQNKRLDTGIYVADGLQLFYIAADSTNLCYSNVADRTAVEDFIKNNPNFKVAIDDNNNHMLLISDNPPLLDPANVTGQISVLGGFGVSVNTPENIIVVN